MSYSTTLERWMQADPTGTQYVDGPNLYQPDDSNPTTMTDPFGTQATRTAPRLLGANGDNDLYATNDGTVENAAAAKMESGEVSLTSGLLAYLENDTVKDDNGNSTIKGYSGRFDPAVAATFTASATNGCDKASWVQFVAMKIDVYSGESVKTVTGTIPSSSQPNPLPLTVNPNNKKWGIDGSKTSPVYENILKGTNSITLVDAPAPPTNMAQESMLGNNFNDLASAHGVTKAVATKYFETFLVVDGNIKYHLNWTRTFTIVDGNPGVSGTPGNGDNFAQGPLGLTSSQAEALLTLYPKQTIIKVPNGA